MDNSSRRFKLLANDTRQQVLQMLFDQSLCVREIMDKLQIEQSLLSHHLKLLKDEGLVTSDRQGKEIYYTVDPSIRDGNDKIFKLGCCDIKF